MHTFQVSTSTLKPEALCCLALMEVKTVRVKKAINQESGRKHVQLAAISLENRVVVVFFSIRLESANTKTKLAGKEASLQVQNLGEPS